MREQLEKFSFFSLLRFPFTRAFEGSPLSRAPGKPPCYAGQRKREFVPPDQVSFLLVVYLSLLLHIN